MRFSDKLDSDNLQAAFAQHPFITGTIYRPRTGSTNTLAKERAGTGAPEGLLVVADEQSAGRGRRGRTWWSPAGSALLTSLLFRPPLPAEEAQQLTMLCALAAADAVTGTTGLTVDLKWPNDLLVRGRKLAGLLTELAFKGARLDYAVVGMGLNVNTDFSAAPPLIAPATSLQIELGRPVDRLDLLVAYANSVGERYVRLKEGASPRDEWASRLITLGRRVTARTGDQTLTGLAEDVDAGGALLLRTDDGALHRLLTADVSLRQD